jgi:predicted nucleic acid-binding protein
MTDAHCRFPTSTGPCRRPVNVDGERGSEHLGLDVVTAAAEVARELRQRTAAQRQRDQRGRARRDADPGIPMSDAQIAAVADLAMALK